MTTPNRINLRVYGICIENDALLISEERQLNTFMRKLPGGGLEFGEGIEDCLKREWQEEMEVDIDILGDVFYINGFFIPSVFDPRDQIVACYYQVKMCHTPGVSATNHTLDMSQAQNGDQNFRWIPLAKLTPEFFTFPADQAVAKRVLEVFVPQV